MTRHTFVRTIVFLIAIAIGLGAASCNGSSGIGMSPNAGPRWGGSGMSGPAIFPGGPSH